MDLEKLKKLTALANHNPNENEANLAARKVCKMLEEAKFSLGSIPRTVEEKLNQHRQNYNYRPTYNPAFWDDIFKRARAGQNAAYGETYRRAYDNETTYQPYDKARKEQEERKNRPFVERECSECGDKCSTKNTDTYYRCQKCIWKEEKWKL